MTRAMCECPQTKRSGLRQDFCCPSVVTARMAADMCHVDAEPFALPLKGRVVAQRVDPSTIDVAKYAPQGFERL